MNVSDITVGAEKASDKKKLKVKRFDKFNNPILKGIQGKTVTFRDEIEGKPVTDIHIVDKLEYTERSSKC